MYADSQVANNPLSGRVLNRNAKGGTPGTRFAQRDDVVKVAKREARWRVLDLFNLSGFPQQLCLLTFPSTNWIFEGMLINNRHDGTRWKYEKGVVGHHTMLVGIEREEAIYRAALNFIPSIKQGFRVKPCPPYASSSLRTYSVKRYLRCEFEVLANSEIAVDCQSLKFNGAWLDFNGCINMRRKEAIERFLHNHTNGNCRLVITTGNCHYDAVSELYWGKDKLNALTEWLKSLGGEILYGLQYQSSIPMIEIAADIEKGVN